MRPLRIRLTNFLSYAAADVAFDDLTVACISGANGHGKSALLDAMTYALWGQARKPSASATPSEALVRTGTRDMSVTLDFLLGDIAYRVTRGYRISGKTGSPNLSFGYQNSDSIVNLSGPNMRTTQAAIDGVLRMSFATFTNSVFLLQGHADEFATASPADRKAVLAEVLDLARYETLEKLAREEVEGLRTRLSGDEGKLAAAACIAAERPGAEEGLAACAAKHQAVVLQVQDLENRLAVLREAQAAVTSRNRARREAQDHRVRALRRQEQVRAEHASSQQAATELVAAVANKAAVALECERHDACKAQVAVLTEQAQHHASLSTRLAQTQRNHDVAVARATAALERARGEVTRHQQALSALKPDTCPTCGATMHPEKAAEIRKACEANVTAAQEVLDRAQQSLDQVGEGVPAIEALSAEIAALSYDPAALRTAQVQAATFEGCVARMGAIRQAEAALPEAEARILRLAGVLAEVCGEVLSLTQAIEQLGPEEPDDTRAVAALEAELSGSRRAVTTTAQEQGAWQAKLDHCLKAEAEAKRLSATMEAQRHSLTVYQALGVAYGRSGIQALIIERAIPEIEQEANAILEKLTGGRVTVALESLRDLKKGGTRETLDIRIQDEVGERPYEMFSGGEAFRINFALRIGLSKMLSRRAGVPMRTLIVDEGFGTQDSDGLFRLVDAINTVSGEFDLVLVVTHVDQLKAAFPVTLQVTKGQGGSTLRRM